MTPLYTVDSKALKMLGWMKGTDVWTVIETNETYPVAIRECCQTLAAFPVTQVSVERLFSVMKLLVHDLRSRMKPDVIEAMLLLRTDIE